MILPAQHIRGRLGMIVPFVERGTFQGMSYGLSAAGYDVRIDQDVVLPSRGFCLASTLERFFIPLDVMAIVHDKSSWARRGVVVQNTVLEPGWHGYLTIELSSCLDWGADIRIASGSPIAQLVFHQLTEPTELPYVGKYQNQGRGPQRARDEQ